MNDNDRRDVQTVDDVDNVVATAVAVLDDRDVILVEQVSVCRD